MSKQIPVWIGKDNTVLLPLTIDDESPDPDVITRAMFSFGEYCVDTDIHTTLIWFMDNKRTVRMKLGLIPKLVTGKYKGFLTIFDPASPNGLAWGEVATVRVNKWQKCLNEGD